MNSSERIVGAINGIKLEPQLTPAILKHGTDTIGPYRIDKKKSIRSGGFGVVVGVFKEGRTAALKVGNSSVPVLKDVFSREAAMHASVSNITDEVPAFYSDGEVPIDIKTTINGVTINVSGNFPYIEMEYLPYGTLIERIKGNGGGLRLADVIDILKPPAEAIDSMTRVGLLHRDITPGNIFLRNHNRGVLGDFGAVQKINGGSRNIIGDLAYMQTDGIRDSRDPRVAVYGLGATAVTALTGKSLIPDGISTDNEKFAFLGGPSFIDYLDLITVDLHPAVSDTLILACSQNPDDRPESATGFINSLKVAQRETMAV